MEDSTVVEDVVTDVGVVDVVDIQAQGFAIVEATFGDQDGFVADCVQKFKGCVLGVVLAAFEQLDTLKNNAACTEGGIVNISVGNKLVTPS